MPFLPGARLLDWLSTSGLLIALTILGAVLIARFVSWLGSRITRRIDDRYTQSDDLVRSEATKHFSVWTLFGLLAGVLFALFLDFCDTTIKTESDARRLLGAPTLASIPTLKELRRKNFQELVPEFERGKPLMEAFRNLRNQIEFKGIDKPLRTLAVASARSGEGSRGRRDPGRASRAATPGVP